MTSVYVETNPLIHDKSTNGQGLLVIEKQLFIRQIRSLHNKIYSLYPCWLLSTPQIPLFS